MKKLTILTAMALVGSLTVAAHAAAETAVRVELKHNESQGLLQILVDGKEAVVYQYGANVDMPHYYPVRSPSGQLLTVQQTEPYPHHRSLWFADTVQLAGQRKTSFYFGMNSKDKKKPEAGFRDRIRHVKFLSEGVADGKAAVKAQLVWEADYGKLPVLDEVRQWRVVPLEKGEYLLDLTFELKSSYGDVQFVSDAIHYAWPLVRMHRQFSVDKGGTLTNSEGSVNEKGTFNKPARWVDYSNTVNGVTEGLALFSTDKEPSQFFTRNYGTFGPRRPAAQSGKPFSLKKGESMSQHVGILVHSGDVKAGQVEKRYQQYADGKL